jgi:antitoxin ParD1/3/4
VVGSASELYLPQLSKADNIGATKGTAMPSSYNIIPRNEDLVRALEMDNLKREYAKGKASGEPEDIDPVVFLKGLKAERSRGG